MNTQKQFNKRMSSALFDLNALLYREVAVMDRLVDIQRSVHTQRQVMSELLSIKQRRESLHPDPSQQLDGQKDEYVGSDGVLAGGDKGDER